MNINKLTRVLVLSGTVSLATPGGTATANAEELLVAKGDAKPDNIAVRANSEFAIDLYHRLSEENAGNNLFFSPFSISSALAMCAEGARGQTALEMGKVLKFPDAARRVKGDDAQLIPWETAKIHAGLSELNRLLDPDDTPEKKAVRDKIAELRKKHAAIKLSLKVLENVGGKKYWDKSEEERTVVRELNQLLPQIDQYELNIANALWGEKTYPFREEYLEAVNDSYDTGGAFPADFIGNTEAERERINRWVSEHTANQIDSVLPEGSIDALTRLVITNAIYFRGSWEKPFRKRDTEPADFFANANETLEVPLMKARYLNNCRYAAFNDDGSYFDTPLKYAKGTDPKGYPEKGGFNMVELPYKGDDLSMVVITPREKDGLATVEKALTADNLQRWIGKLAKRTTHVYLPKFETSTEYAMKETLRSLGMESAFTKPSAAGGADFSGMTDTLDPLQRLYITSVFHKAFISVDEEGTKAAAVTAIAVGNEASEPVEMIDFLPTFRADRPFIFLIRDKRSGSVLFLGRITNPE